MFLNSAAYLSSGLLQELCQGLQGLAIHSPFAALSNLPDFLSRTGIRHLEVDAHNLVASAQTRPRAEALRHHHLPALWPWRLAPLLAAKSCNPCLPKAIVNAWRGRISGC